MGKWNLLSAKAQLGAVVRKAQLEGPQMITLRGDDTAVVLSTADYQGLIEKSGETTWVDRFRAGFIGEIDLTRDEDGLREADPDASPWPRPWA
jgi:prevent-host-death family protein